MSKVTPVLLPLCLLVSANISAEVIRAEVYSADDAYDAICSSNISTTDTLSNCSGTAFYKRGETFNSLSYSSSAIVTSDLSLKSQSSLTYTIDVEDPNSEDEWESFGETPVREYSSYMDSYSTASWGDAWTITGGEDGQTGYLSIFYAIDGTVDNTIPSTASAYSSLWLREIITTTNDAGTTFITSSNTNRDIANFNAQGSVDEVVELGLEFTFGETFDLALNLTSFVSFSYFESTPWDASAYTDFFNTATLDNIMVFNESGSSINFRLDSEGDLEAFETFSNLVDTPPKLVSAPESIALFFVGLVGLRRATRKVGRKSHL